MRIHVGTSGYSYREWKGRFYPRDLPASEMLPFYAQRFSSVEINNTFYGMPTAPLLRGWKAQVGRGFVFALKAPQDITHRRQLKDAGALLTEFLGLAKGLGTQRGPVLFQLPPNFKKDLPRLETFLATLFRGGRKGRFAFEFRHASWFDEDVFAALKARDAALCVAEDEKLATPFHPTASWGYLRLRRDDYSPRDVKAWASRVQQAPWSEAFVFFKHEDQARGPELAQRFVGYLA